MPSGEEFRWLLETAFEGVLRVDAQAHINYLNPRMAEMLGYSTEELMGRSLYDICPPDTHESLTAYIARREEGLKEQFEFALQHRDGSRVWGLVTTNPLYDAQGRYVGAIAMITDVTQRRRAEEASREAEEKWRSLVEHTPQAILMVDPEGTICFANHPLYSADVSDVIGRSIFSYLPPEELERVRGYFAQVFREGCCVRYESQASVQGDRRVWHLTTMAPVIHAGRVSYATIISQDITDLKDAEALLRKSESLLAKAQELAHLGSWEWDLRDNRITWSDELCRIYGLSPDDFGARYEAYLRQVHPDDREQARADIMRIIETNKPGTLEFRIRRPDGSERHLYAKAEPVVEEGRAVRVVGMSQDVTEMRLAHQEVLRRTRELHEARELDHLKSNFVNSVSHELRTPLTSIMGYAEFLEDDIGGPLTPDQRTYVNEISQGAKRLERLVDDLLDFARIDSGTFRLKRVETDLTQKVREIVASFQPQAQQARLCLATDLPEEPLTAHVDPQRIGQVLINLIGNAIKFTPEGGTITVRARASADELRCEVHDTGAGVSVEDTRKLFQRFMQLPNSSRKGGAGLGLAISRSLIEAHGGHIGVDSTPGEGSTFWFTLPRG